MFGRDLDCLDTLDTAARDLCAVRPAGLAAFVAGLTDAQAAYLRDSGFTGKDGELCLLPGPGGVAAAVLGLGDGGASAFGKLPFALPADSVWRFVPGDYDQGDAVLGFCLGAYVVRGLKAEGRRSARLSPSPGQDGALAMARAIWLARDLINAPANLLGPAELAEAARGVAERHGARFTLTSGAALAAGYPAVAAVGAGADRPPCVAELHWGHADAPLVSLCGKGVCFDTGGYDLKPSAAMLRMKKDMGGAAVTLGLAQMIMQAGLPVRLVARIGCVENSVSGRAMRPMDVLATRRGLHVEIGNTDAEGRLVLCDLLAQAADENPDILIDFATLTGAARAALGPDLPALFSNDEILASQLLEAGQRVGDPLWRLPLWKRYDSWLKSPVADLNNVSSKPFAGAIVAALFLQRFLRPDTRWAHIDTYCWNDQTSPGRPEGGETQGLRAAFDAISTRVHAAANNRIRKVT